MNWLRRLLGLLPRQRVRGRPPSGNGASSSHLWWDLAVPLAWVSATLEVVEPPTVQRLYFFALQASFWDENHRGGAHVGLQWNPRHPGSTAVNWGGYDDSGAILTGTESPLPSTPSDPNTRDLAWVPAARYRLTIGPRDQSGWPARLVGIDTGENIIIRSLLCEGDHLRNPVVWSEVFADCDHPSVAVRWSDMRALTTDGKMVAVQDVRASYQSHADGGCSNTTAVVETNGVLQQTTTERLVPQDAVVAWETT